MNVILGIVAMILGTSLALYVVKMIVDMVTDSCDDADRKGWIRFDKKKPKESGWYLCTVEQGSRFPMLLYWEWSSGKFTDPVRQSVFNNYEVMVTKKFEEGVKTEAIMPDDEYMERIYTDDACDRTKYVIAWKPEPRVFMGEVKNNRNSGKERANQVTVDAGHNSDEIVRKLTEGLEQRMHGKKYDLSLEEVDEIVSKYVSRVSNGMFTADELRSALINAETITIHNNGRK